MKAILFQEKNQWPKLVEDFHLDAPSNEKETFWKEVEVKAAAFNRRDYWITKGMYPGLRPDIVLGSDACGMHEGREVIVNPGLFWGDNQYVQSDNFEVLGMPRHGTFCEKLFVPEENIFDKPKHLSVQEAAALPLAGLTAYRALFSRGRCSSTSRVLINGVGGGVAAMALQFALAAGAEVYVTSGTPSKMDKAIALGASGAKNYKDEDWSKEWLEKKILFDVIIDSAGGDHFNHLVKLSAPGACISVYGGTRGNIGRVNVALLFWRQISIHGSTMGSPQDFQAMLNLVNEHKIHPLIDRTVGMDDYVQAFEVLENSHQFGKIVMNIS